MNPAWMLLAIPVVASVAWVAYRAGFSSAAAYLPAARAVSDVSAAAVQQANEFVGSLDKNEAALTSLQGAIAKLEATVAERNQAVEDALFALFQGLERAGMVSSGTVRRAPRQVGEAPSDAG